jgi:hypothetical protein
VPSWNIVPPQDPEAVQALIDAYFETEGDLRPILRTLFNSDFFKQAMLRKIKSPADFVVGTVKLSGAFKFPEPGLPSLAEATAVMGQNLMVPPTVEGWHTGHEWIDGGTLNERVNFAVNQVADTSKPGVQSIIDRLVKDGSNLSPERFVERCLELAGPVDAAEDTMEGLMEYALEGGELKLDTPEHAKESTARITRMLQLIVASLDYQFA